MIAHSHQPSSSRGGVLSVLVIDDDEVDRERVRRFLAKGGMEASVHEQADPLVALNEFKLTAPDIVLLDYSFPRHDGLTVLRELRELDPTVPVIVLTGFDETTLAVELMKAGAVDYLPKSTLTAQRLVQSVRHAQRLRSFDRAARTAQDALRESEELNRRILESSHDCIKVLDLDGTLLMMSSGGQRLLGITDGSALRGQSWLGFWEGEHRRGAEAALQEARSGRPGRFVGLSHAQDGRALWFDVLITPMLDRNGYPERLLAISREVTEQHRQAEFEQQLLGIVSHDLRNPITAMTLAGELLKRELPADSPLIAVADRIVGSGHRAARLVHDLLDFTRVRLTGALPIDKSEGDIHEICQQAVAELAPPQSGRTIVHRAEGDGAGIWDPERIAQVVGNLARNALSYGAPDTVVTVRSSGMEARVRIDVHNHGEPIAEPLRAALFQPFRRGDQRGNSERSVGLGLFIVREIVVAHGGSLEVISNEEDGTTFRVELPRS